MCQRRLCYQAMRMLLRSIVLRDASAAGAGSNASAQLYGTCALLATLLYRHRGSLPSKGNCVALLANTAAAADKARAHTKYQCAPGADGS